MVDAENNFIVEGRIIYAHLSTPDRFGKYTCQLVVDKKAKVIKDMKAKINDLIKSSLGGKKPNHPGKMAIIEASESLGEDFADSYLIKCKSSDVVRMLSATAKPIEDDKIFVNGCDVKALVSLSAYTNEYGPGLTAFINGVQYVGPNESIGKAKPNNETIDAFFAPIEGADDSEEGTKSKEADFFTT